MRWNGSCKPYFSSRACVFHHFSCIMFTMCNRVVRWPEVPVSAAATAIAGRNARENCCARRKVRLFYFSAALLFSWEVLTYLAKLFLIFPLFRHINAIYSFSYSTVFVQQPSWRPSCPRSTPPRPALRYWNKNPAFAPWPAKSSWVTPTSLWWPRSCCTSTNRRCVLFYLFF